MMLAKPSVSNGAGLRFSGPAKKIVRPKGRAASSDAQNKPSESLRRHPVTYILAGVTLLLGGSGFYRIWQGPNLSKFSPEAVQLEEEAHSLGASHHPLADSQRNFAQYSNATQLFKSTLAKSSTYQQQTALVQEDIEQQILPEQEFKQAIANSYEKFDLANIRTMTEKFLNGNKAFQLMDTTTRRAIQKETYSLVTEMVKVNDVIRGHNGLNVGIIVACMIMGMMTAASASEDAKNKVSSKSLPKAFQDKTGISELVTQLMEDLTPQSIQALLAQSDQTSQGITQILTTLSDAAQKHPEIQKSLVAAFGKIPDTVDIAAAYLNKVMDPLLANKSAVQPEDLLAQLQLSIEEALSTGYLLEPLIPEASDEIKTIKTQKQLTLPETRTLLQHEIRVANALMANQSLAYHHVQEGLNQIHQDAAAIREEMRPWSVQNGPEADRQLLRLNRELQSANQRTSRLQKRLDLASQLILKTRTSLDSLIQKLEAYQDAVYQQVVERQLASDGSQTARQNEPVSGKKVNLDDILESLTYQNDLAQAMAEVRSQSSEDTLAAIRASFLLEPATQAKAQ